MYEFEHVCACLCVCMCVLPPRVKLCALACVCLRVCVCVSVCVCACVSMHAGTHAKSMYACMYLSLCALACVCPRACVHVHVRVWVWASKVHVRPCAWGVRACKRARLCMRIIHCVHMRTHVGSVRGTSCAALTCKYTMYGDGLTTRSARYTSKGSANVRRSKRCDSTSWKMSPARMCSFAMATASRNASCTGAQAYVHA